MINHKRIIPICCHTQKVNRLWEEAENWYVDRLTIDIGLAMKEINLYSFSSNSG